MLSVALFSLTASLTPAKSKSSQVGYAAGVISSNLETKEMELPPGFRFHPTDEELITHYLSKKALDGSFHGSFEARAITEVDFNKCEPWDLPQRGKLGEKEWYFFCVRDRKYPTGLRTNRATDAGYWKATGKDKEICRGKVLIGMKKTLVFYKGRVPRGEKTNWVMHEYRLEGYYSIYCLSRAAKNEWGLCRVFQKRSIVNGKEAFGLAKLGFFSHEEVIEGGFPSLPTLPPLMDIPCDGKGLPPHVTCFSNAMEGPKAHDPELMISASAATAADAFHCFNSPFQAAPESKPSVDMSSIFLNKFMPMPATHKGGDIMNLLEGDSFLAKQGCKMEREMHNISQETGLTTDMNQGICSGDEIWRNSFEYCLWNC